VTAAIRRTADHRAFVLRFALYFVLRFVLYFALRFAKGVAARTRDAKRDKRWGGIRPC
jgi:hypothetical protein